MNCVKEFVKIYSLTFLIMSISDSDHWASQVINELIEEIANFDRNSDINAETVGSLWQNCNTDGELVTQESEIEQNQESAIEHTEEVYETYKDCITGSPCALEGEYLLLRSTDDVSAINDVHSDESLEFKMTGDDNHFISAVAETDSTNVVKTLPDELGNVPNVDTGNSSEDIIAQQSDSKLANANEKMTAHNTFDHSKPSLADTGKVCDILSKDEECNNKRPDEKFSFLTIGLEPETGFSVEYLKKTDEKVESLGFKSQQGKDGVSERSSSLADLYFKYFSENYIKEEIDYRWSFQSKSCNDCKTYTPVNFQSNVLKKPESVDLKPEPEENACETEVINQEAEVQDISIEFRPFKRKHRNILEEIDADFENLYSQSGQTSLENNANSTGNSFESRLENNIFSVGSDESVKNISEIKRTEICAPERNNCILPREIFSPKFLRRKRRKLGHDEEDDLVITKRIDKIITVYRTICKVFEDLFLRPSATIITESIEFLVFLLFLSVYSLCIIYKETSLNALKRNKDSFIDMFKRGNQKMKSSFSKLFLSINTLEHETETNKNCFRNETPLVRFSPKVHSNDAPGKNNPVNVEPDDVFILNSVFEEVKQSLEDMYDKGDNYFKYLNAEPRRAAVASSDEDFVDIILRECTKVTEVPHSTRNESDVEVAAISKANCCTEHGSNESIANKFCNSLPISPKSCCEGEVPHCSKILKRAISNELLLKEFDLDSDREKGFVLNSTEIEGSEFSTRAKSRNRSMFHILLTSDKVLCESSPIISSTPTTSCRKSCSNSSMSVNLPSFRSRSQLDLNSETSSLLNAPKIASVQDFCLRDTLPKEPDMINVQEVRPPVDLQELGKDTGLLHNVTPTGSISIPCIKKSTEQECEGYRDNFTAQTLENLHDSLPLKANFSGDPLNIENVSTDDLHVCSLQCGNSFSFDNPDFLSELTRVNTSSDEMDSLMVNDCTSMCDDRISKGRKNSVNLRRRMSVILNNWKNMNMMHCVTSNLKGRKKYKKQLDIIET